MVADPAQASALARTAIELRTIVGQITPEEFRWQEANYDRNSTLGRELLFLIANDEWARATSETIDMTRSDTVETTVKIDIGLDRITHEAFRDRPGRIWLPALVLPPSRPLSEPWPAGAGSRRPAGPQRPARDRRKPPEPDPFVTLTVTDASGDLLATLPDADVRHRISAALAEIIVNIAVARWAQAGNSGDAAPSATRDQRLMLSAAIYRLLRREHPDRRAGGDAEAVNGNGGRLPWLRNARRELGQLLDSYIRLLDAGHGPGAGQEPAPHELAAGAGTVTARELTERAVRVLRAFAESAVVVVAVDRDRTPAVLTVTVPSRALHQAPARPVRPERPARPADSADPAEPAGLAGLAGLPDPADPASAGRWRGTGPRSWRWLRPGTWNWILPRAYLQVDLLLASADADRQVQVNLPDGVSFDPSLQGWQRASLDVRVRAPVPMEQLAQLMGQLLSVGQDWPWPLYQGLADQALVKTDATLAALREHAVVADPPRPAAAAGAGEVQSATSVVRGRLEQLRDALHRICSQEEAPGLRTGLASAWAGGSWLPAALRRRTSADPLSPAAVVARASMIEDISQRADATSARIHVHVAVTDAEYFSVARFSGWMSALLMTVVLVFFLASQILAITSDEVSAEVLAFVLTLFSAIQAGRIERADRSSLRGLLSLAGNGLIVASVLPTVILAVALAFSRTALWAITWAAICLGLQLLLQSLLRLRLRRDLRGERRTAGGAPPDSGLFFYTDRPDYSHSEVLHSGWWRSTTAEALMIGRQAYGYVVWQHGELPTLRAVLRAGRPAPMVPAAEHGGPSWPRRGRDLLASLRRPDGPAADADDEIMADGGAVPGPGGLWSGTDGADSMPSSLLESPASVLALLRSGTASQSLTFAVFRDLPAGNLATGLGGEEVIPVNLDPDQLAPVPEIAGMVEVFLGLIRGQQTPVPDHPVTAVLATAARHRLTVLEVQLPVPAPAAAFAGLHWARVQIGLPESGMDRLAPFLDAVYQLALARGPRPGRGRAAGGLAVVGVKTSSEGRPRFLAVGPGVPRDHPASHLVLASQLDVVAACGAGPGDSGTVRDWRVLAICADGRSGIENDMLASIDPGLRVAGLTYALLHGKAVILLLGHQPGGARRPRQPRAVAPPEAITVYLDKWQSRKDLGVARPHPLLRVHLRTPDRPGATLQVLESLRTTLLDVAPGVVGPEDWNVWYARVATSSGGYGLLRLTVRLAMDLETVQRWKPTQFEEIDRKTRALAARKLAAFGGAASSPDDDGLDAPIDTVIRIRPVEMPDP